MPEFIDILRQQAQQLILQKMARDRRHGVQTQGQARSADAGADIHGLAVDPSAFLPLQVLDPLDANFGRPYFLPDYDPPDCGLPLR